MSRIAIKERHQCFLKKIIVGGETTQAVRGLVELLQSTLIHREMCLYSIVPQEYGKQSKVKFINYSLKPTHFLEQEIKALVLF